MATVRPTGAPAADAVPLEHLVRDKHARAPLPATGLVYCGSLWRTNEAGQAECLADTDGPRSLASTYNERITVLDVPRQAGQDDVYQRYRINAAHLFEKGALLEIVLRPETRPDGTPRVLNARLRLTPGPAGVAAARIDSRAPETLSDALQWLRNQTATDRDPFVTLDWSDAMPLSQARATAQVLQAVQGENGIRLEPPLDGQIFYRALLPDEAWRTRAERPSQPPELRISLHDDHPTATLTIITEKWVKERIDPELTVRDVAIDTPDTLVEQLAALDLHIPVILAFAPASLPLGEIMAYLRPIHETHGTVYLFVE